MVSREPKQKHYWILIFFLLPLGAMFYYFWTFEYKVDPHLASQAGISPDSWIPGQPSSHTLNSRVPGMLSYRINLAQPAFRLPPSGNIQLAGQIVLSNNSANPVTVIDAPLSEKKLWNVRISPVAGGLGKQLLDLPLIETVFKDSKPLSESDSETNYVTIGSGRELHINFVCTLKEDQLSPGKYLLEILSNPRVYAQSRGIDPEKAGVSLDGIYGQVIPFEVLPVPAETEEIKKKNP